MALATFLPAQAEQTALVASLQKELAHVKEDGLMGRDDWVISLFRETNLLSTRKKFKAKKNHRKKIKAPCFAYGFLTHLNSNHSGQTHCCLSIIVICVGFMSVVSRLISLFFQLYSNMFSVFSFLHVFHFCLFLSCYLLVSFLNSLPW